MGGWVEWVAEWVAEWVSGRVGGWVAPTFDQRVGAVFRVGGSRGEGEQGGSKEEKNI